MKLKISFPIVAEGGGGAVAGSLCDSARGLLLIGAVAAVLSGCAAARVADVTTASPAGQRPTEILVDVRPALDATDPHMQTAAQVSGQLQGALIQQLTKSGITAEPYAGTPRQGAVTLHVSVTNADPGSAVQRFVIGLGAGMARLAVSADLQADGPIPMTAFSTSSDSGRKLGLLVPGGVAVATGDAIHLAIGGGIDLVTAGRGGMEKPLHATSTAIVQQIHRYYEQAGWYWPAHG